MELNWKEMLGLAAIILAIAISLGGCNYLCALADKVTAETQQMEKK